MKEQTALDYLMVQTRRDTIIAVTDEVVNSCSNGEDLGHTLFDCDAWFDIYNHSTSEEGHFREAHSDFFEDEYSECVRLHKAEYTLWLVALVRNGREELIPYLSI